MPPPGDDAVAVPLEPVPAGPPPPSPATPAAAGEPSSAGPAAGPEPGGRRVADSFLRAVGPLAGVLANVTVLTALLVYFGWRRSETQSQRLGIDQSILALSTRDYLLRSIGPVLVLLIGVAGMGLAWVAIDRRVAPWFATGPGSAAVERSRPRAARRTLRVLGSAWLVLPVAVWLLGLVSPSPAFVLFPVSIGLGVLALVYAAHLHYPTGEPDAGEQRRVVVRAAFALLLACVCLFWTASNYAEVLGARLADGLPGRIERLPAVNVYSEEPLFLDGPGVVERPLDGGEGELRFLYRGLRLYDHTGGRLLLLSDGWTPTEGVVFVIDDDEPIRIEFVQDVP